MAFVLMARSRGDELMRSTTSVVAESADRAALEQLMEERAAERRDWLAANYLPEWAEYTVIAAEEIVEVPAV